MSRDKVTLVIPTYNMSGYIQDLWSSIITSGLYTELSEVIFVDDGSTDDTLTILESLSSPNSEEVGLRIVSYSDNKGRFMARYIGAKEASSERILFLDSRIILPDDFGKEFAQVKNEYNSVVGSVDIDVNRSVYCLYWERSHKLVFTRHFKESDSVIILDQYNYDDYLKGTGVFLCSRKIFIECCNNYIAKPLLSDDTYLMKDMVMIQPIAIHPKLRISWVPRENLKDFLLRMWERGPSFVEYHIFASRGGFFKLVMFLLIALLGVIICGFFNPLFLLLAFVFSMLLVSFSTIFMSENIGEFFRLLPIHVLTVFTFGAAILYGIAVNITKSNP